MRRRIACGKEIMENRMPAFIENHTAMEQRNYTGSFCGFVLLNKETYNLQALADRMKEQWGIEPYIAKTEDLIVEGGQEGDWFDQLLKEEDTAILTEPEIQDNNLVFEIPGAMIVIGFVPEAVPDGEAERFAKNNETWKEALEVTKEHKAHLMIAVLPGEKKPLDAGMDYVKIVSSALEDPSAVAVYTSGTVLEPKAYQNEVQNMKDGKLPIDNWLHFGFYQNEAGNNAYTIGMDAFGKDELEILGSKRTPEELNAFLMRTAIHVLQDDLMLHEQTVYQDEDGTEIDIKREDAVAVEGHSIQFAI